MAVIKPFRALRPAPKEAAQVAAVPYDVVSRAEAARLAAGNAHSFLRVTRAEIELPETVDVYAPEVYDRAKENLARFERENVLRRDAEPSVYVYRLVAGNQSQTAVVALCSLDEYESGAIKKHEKTRPEKEDDRTRHILRTRAQTGLIFLCYRGTETINRLVSRATTTAPLYDFSATDGVQHTIWQAENSAELTAAFADVPALYIADGHHRAASAARARATLQKSNNGGDHGYVVAAMFPAEQLKILAYNRVVKDLNGLGEAEFLNRIKQHFAVSETKIHVPKARGEFCLYLAGKWHKLVFNPTGAGALDPVNALDASILQNFLLQPILRIEDPRTDRRIDFVGGARGARELEKLVNEGKFKAAFSLYPTTVQDLLTVADRGEIMPPKSTWFEPKLRDGLLIHIFEGDEKQETEGKS